MPIAFSLLSSLRLFSTPSNVVPGSASFSSKTSSYAVKVGIPEFLNGVGKGVEAHVEKLESEIGDIQKLLVTRTLRLKKLGIPCKQDINGDTIQKGRLGSLS
ncbi:unnamed protein product [Thlaspi arvense]|uniref:Small ribosomal subunit protein mS41 SAM domain-containing protein n=1 Tax=Thlaspi arvense TaxID=13288 RepID=A0AAU9SKK4_THLAR|nr:unnamed protein product [Thlaspi arvense]